MLQRKQQAHLVECEGDVALFFHLGQKFFIEAPNLSQYLPQMWSALASPTESHSLQQMFTDLWCPAGGLRPDLSQKGLAPISAVSVHASSSTISYDQIVKNLMDLRLVEYVPVQTSVATQDSVDLSFHQRELAGLVTWLNGRRRNPLQHQEAPDFQSQCVAFDVLSTPVAVVQAYGNTQGLVLAFGEAGFTDTQFFTVSASDPMPALDSKATVILWGRWGKINPLRRLHHELIRRGQPWMLVIEDDFGGSIGPAYRGLGTPCLECLIQRRKSSMVDRSLNEKIESFAESNEQNFGIQYSPWRRRLADLAAFELIKDLSQVVHSKVRQGVFEFDFLNHNNRFHEVLPVPHCEVCLVTSRQPPIWQGQP